MLKKTTKKESHCIFREKYEREEQEEEEPGFHG
jgi:hypothetical protein